jgi:hypothetical protein
MGDSCDVSGVRGASPVCKLLAIEFRIMSGDVTYGKVNMDDLLLETAGDVKPSAVAWKDATELDAEAEVTHRSDRWEEADVDCEASVAVDEALDGRRASAWTTRPLGNLPRSAERDGE